MKLKLEKTKLQDEYGRPINFYHTTNVSKKIEHFLPLTHFGTKKAAEMRGIHFMYQSLGISEPAILPSELPQELEKKLQHSSQISLKTYQVHLHVKSPLCIFDFGKHDISNYQGWFLRQYSPKSIYLTPKECLERDNVGVGKMAYKKALTEFIFQNPKTLSIEKLKKELNSETLFSADSEDTTELTQNVIRQRMIRYLETEGYDSFVYKNDCEDKGQKSYIIFRPEQVFQGSETEHTICPPNKEKQDFLNQVENDFFKDMGIIPPYQRKEVNKQIRNKSFIKTR